MVFLDIRISTCCIILSCKVSAGNSGHPKTPDTWYISTMDESFGLKLWVLNI